ncbi:MAG TPA: glycosyltransferase family A protein [Candidatus Acidoferrum sp.]|jgi:glycosyltransferase involved in cell wall biosynthesis|nr:glycosyltransferase family A protein [Candidatus Acidoferrum sp.]
MIRGSFLDAPRFSIIITSHNQSAYIRDAVNSALEQGYEAKEIVVVDDASSDASPQILKEYGDKIHLAAFQTNQGVTTSRNLGAAMATGEYFVFLDGDDVMLPWALDVYGRIVDAKKPQIILSCMQWFESSLQHLQSASVPHQIEFAEYELLLKRDRRYQAGGSAIVVARQVFQAVNGWTDQFFPLEDIDLLMKLGNSGPTVQILSPCTKGYRIHSSNVRHRVPGMVEGLNKVMEREKSGVYPGGSTLRRERYAVLGAPVFFWIKSAFTAGLYGTAIGVLARGWPMFLATCAQKIKASVHGRQKTEVLSFEFQPKGTRERQSQSAKDESAVPVRQTAGR